MSEDGNMSAKRKATAIMQHHKVSRIADFSRGDGHVVFFWLGGRLEGIFEGLGWYLDTWEVCFFNVEVCFSGNCGFEV